MRVELTDKGEKIMERINKTEYIVAMTGGSGSVYGVRLVTELLSRGYSVHLILSDLGQELSDSGQMMSNWIEDMEKRYASQIKVVDSHRADAEIGKHSYLWEGMIVVPCSMTTIAQIAHGVDENLILNCANICVKQHRNLILVPRETPLTQVHLENMLTLAKEGVQIVPAMPAVTHKPTTLTEMVDYMVGKILDGLEIENRLTIKDKEK